MSDQLFGEYSDVGEQLAAERKYGTGAFVYLVAIGTATLGWLWLIGSAAFFLSPRRIPSEDLHAQCRSVGAMVHLKEIDRADRARN